MSVSRPIITVLAHFEPLLTAPIWKKVVNPFDWHVVSAGSSNRNGSAVAHGTSDERAVQRVSSSANRARWSPSEVCRRLLQVLVATYVGVGGVVEIVINETLDYRA